MSIVLLAEADSAFKTNVDIVQGIVTIIGVLVAGSYFIYRVLYQRLFQRLSAELKLTKCLVGNQPYLRIKCLVTNKADARINFDRMQYSLFWLDAAGSREQLRSEAFCHNLHAEGLNHSYQEGPGQPTTEDDGPTPSKPEDLRGGSSKGKKVVEQANKWAHSTYSVDADSVATFETLVPLGRKKGIYVVQVEFSPKLVPDRYVVETHCVVN